MSLLDEEDKLIEQADDSVNNWNEKRKRGQYNEYTWIIDGKKVKFWGDDFHLSSKDYSDFKYEIYKF